MPLSEEQILRYSRNILLKGVGGEGQQRLLASRVLLVGAGGLGSPAALYLAAAGVGTIGVADGDDVDLTNLQRQIAHTTETVGRPKTESSAEALRRSATSDNLAYVIFTSGSTGRLSSTTTRV